MSNGNHGYDNKLPSMQAIFMAMGPDFNEKTEIQSLKNVDIYHIVCKILSLEPNSYANAGSLNKLTEIFGKKTAPSALLTGTISTSTTIITTTSSEAIIGTTTTTTATNKCSQISIDFFLAFVFLVFFSFTHF